jgi:integrase
MASASITTRHRKTGKRYVVRFRRGGRYYPIEHGGSFTTMREARARRDLIAGELAAGRDPTDAIRALTESRAARTVAQWAESYVESRVDIGERTREVLRSHLKTILPTFGDSDPARITPADVQEWIARSQLAPASLKRYIATLRLVLDFAGIDPNPARDRRVKLPPIIVDEPNPPSSEHFLAILERVPQRTKLPLAVLEQTAMRTGDVLGLTWGDVDASGRRFRLPRRRTKTRRGLWVSVPPWLMEAIEATCPLEDRVAERKVFLGLSEKTLYHAVAGACKTAKIPHYHPHDLRHRRASLWLTEGVPVKEVQERGGWSQATTLLETYAHVMPLDEVETQRYEAVLTA